MLYHGSTYIINLVFEKIKMIFFGYFAVFGVDQMLSIALYEKHYSSARSFSAQTSAHAFPGALPACGGDHHEDMIMVFLRYSQELLCSTIFRIVSHARRIHRVLFAIPSHQNPARAFG